jgi:hypothetical protein
MSMTLIETKTLGTAAAAIEFTSIPQNGTDLLILFSLRSTASDIGTNTFMTINGTTTGYSERMLRGLDNATGSFSQNSTSIQWQYTTGANATSNTFNNTSIYIPNYTGSTSKSLSMDNVTEQNGTNSSFQVINAVLWNNTAAITSFAITATANWAAGSAISLYKITKGSDGIVTVS